MDNWMNKYEHGSAYNSNKFKFEHRWEYLRPGVTACQILCLKAEMRLETLQYLLALCECSL